MRLIATGGTIDCDRYDEKTGKSLFSETKIPSLLEDARLHIIPVVEYPLVKDSADITDEDRELILQTCDASPEEKIVITHGTDTMAETAQYLGSRITGKVVVLTGSIVPYVFPASDALFNIGFAFSSVEHLPPGVYVAMNGCVFPWNNVRKNREKLVFENLKKM